ncbi:hypothetical protein LPJ56_002488 [Coemansia sp. RSA 2599]|nr:hypothetical protein LPJ75_002176 [Coemansia sp. RSA 2598]KAJ1825819.1 hypothetical protein LPJ56_002488 [Coemansia sp. RSA 2599]
MNQQYDFAPKEFHYDPGSLDTHVDAPNMSTDPIVLTAYRNPADTLVPSDQTNAMLTPTTPSNNEDTMRPSSTSLRAKLLRILQVSGDSVSARYRISGSSVNTSEEFLVENNLWNRLRRGVRRFVVGNLRWLGLSVALVFAVVVMIVYLAMLDDP